MRDSRPKHKLRDSSLGHSLQGKNGTMDAYYDVRRSIYGPVSALSLSFCLLDLTTPLQNPLLAPLRRH